MELCKCNLEEFNLNQLDIEQKIIIIKQIICGLQYLHSMYFIHRDIKLSNIFVSLDNKIKLGDFGFSTKSFENNNEDLGTFGYIAPEILAGKNYDYRGTGKFGPGLVRRMALPKACLGARGHRTAHALEAVASAQKWSDQV